MNFLGLSTRLMWLRRLTKKLFPFVPGVPEINIQVPQELLDRLPKPPKGLPLPSCQWGDYGIYMPMK
jgi:hypothetical protein